MKAFQVSSCGEMEINRCSVRENPMTGFTRETHSTDPEWSHLYVCAESDNKCDQGLCLPGFGQRY